ncbi:MAG: hypothetical protein SWK76_13105 [Actinomycetota bacterium]|nr:hypothetical protein [Actinomycetota bacterium]
MQPPYETREALKEGADKALGRSIGETEWRGCQPKEEPPYDNHDLRECLLRIKTTPFIPLHRSSLNMGGSWYRGDYVFDDDGYIVLESGGELEPYRISQEAYDIANEFLTLTAGINEEEVASGNISDKLKRKIIGFTRKRGLLGLGFMGFDAFVGGPSGEYMVAGDGTWTCPLELYFMPYVEQPEGLGELLFPQGFREVSGMDETSDSDIRYRFFRIYREHIDDFAKALLELKNNLRAYTFYPNEGTLFFPSRAKRFVAGISPSKIVFKDETAFGVSLDFPYLLSAIYLATVNMLKYGWKLKACKNDNCEALFLTSPKNKGKRERLYCCMQCKNAQAYRDWYWSDDKKRKDGVHLQENG